MAIDVRPAMVFGDVKTMVGPKRADANVCWCLSYRRIPTDVNRTLTGEARGEYVRELCRSDPPPGVLAYDGDEVVGWAALAPRSATSFSRSRKIPHVDDLDVWSLWCIRTRPGRRGQGITHALIEGAVRFARENGAPAIEGYPVDNKGRKVNQVMAYVGTRAMFERAGFTKAADTDSVSDGIPRVVMRKGLR